ncbi:cytochrome c oxidase cbb3-type subunit 3 [Altererythrobacter atlanticus]|uniref:Cbb3-type cytochrome c oxidase subunit n=1 Tax=Croceibacterium atlanticum TaxID=1267766 RepID=A0A0F7KY90_9SPHN|nr:cytochrome-c oxidase, cbb3-type subunit III [Croceibacterium atlanticum]AKH43785.1 Cbb3-type cytochrome c oxidase subunit CcoP [Croceibacterium atlanticum]MBB5733766.1 cytochrome c oxidase cbb3-type subunit 3 [Croceibacterium atlanticum]
MANKHIDEATGVETVGHEWDGIEELNNPLPRWWIWSFYACIAFAIGYGIAYPAWPLINKGTEGVLGWTSRGQLAKELETQQADRASVVAELASMPVGKIQGNEQLTRAAIAGGRAAFKVNCVQCHGAGAAGSEGYPNLNDDDWLWGGDLNAIETTLLHGIRQPGVDETRLSIMPAYGDGFLTGEQIDQLADHVLSLSGKAQPNPAGAQLFAENCAVCHGENGRGLREFGAPNLADAIWLYGGTREQVARQISNPRMGVMPSWEGRLDPVTIKMLAVYVHSLGGGEDFAEVAEEAGDSAPEADPDEQS